MGFLQDILPIFKKHTLVLQEKRNETGDIVTFIFKPQEKLQWKSGQHGIFFINHVKIKKSSRAFSIASTPDDGEIMISMRITKEPSEYKKALMTMAEGTTITMRGPIGSFYVEENNPVLMVAGGIGITPYRALIKEVSQSQNTKILPKSITLLYLDSKEQYIYHNEFQEMSQDPKINIKHLNSRESLKKEMEDFINQHNNEGKYYLSGSGTMVKELKQTLKDKGISKKQIKNDIFIGY
ncbi:FAD-dependent oxidoreductase [Alkaliphilus hydrothermalis]|uniref:Ferredoxin-NADP reductase n=1 Tax=Alkaliphilus hydrothermalis TaxID=1482730 RepID=A0ABS2NT30_9FIRM|nr:FAD-dependent oxidoreductase [Alkaliphilus hydrothermalis]MBM7616110.1 ferredoxin-NADP reductase [Alkaliphilus hydrothermalis]